VSPDESDRGVTFIEWSLDRPDSVEYDFAVSDLARDVVDGVPAVLTDLRAPDPDVGLESLAEAVAATGAVLLVDEVYAPFVDDPLTGNGTAFGGATAAGAPSTAVSNSLTKFPGLDALRLGWLVADPGAVERLSSMRTHLLDVSRTSRYFGRVALHNAETLAERSRRVLRENAALLAEGLRAFHGVLDSLG
jgi:histidinol-phosphate/aromatic aminotransferase/cobyric acid decarboxylase-like protein